ncbi:MAG: nucleoside-diphosphate-sugar pyrophosphorylase [Candidatus Omnitrophica bacterium CG07_land_8_20_14_0_80_50_8]|nr:MAG: nucleoside-diphosphate-sugar pyrophosphorylase [Candidatus Omnitrophica bacterium CG07_land_8_20_14_0_80_50_8]
MKAVILAAGYATRLYPLTIDKPKCLLKAGGRTILDVLCDKLEAVHDLEELIVVTNAKFFGQLTEWGKNRMSRLPLRVLNDHTISNETRLGAIGDLRFAIQQSGAEADILMLASDNLFDATLSDFVNFAQSKKDAVSVGLYDIKDPKLAAKKFGVLEIDKDSRIIGIEEKPEFPKSSFIGMGIYYFPKDSLTYIQAYLKDPNAQDAPGYYIRWLRERVTIFGFRFSGLWYDIGNLKALEDANRDYKTRTNPSF